LIAVGGDGVVDEFGPAVFLSICNKVFGGHNQPSVIARPGVQAAVSGPQELGSDRVAVPATAVFRSYTAMWLPQGVLCRTYRLRRPHVVCCGDVRQGQSVQDGTGSALQTFVHHSLQLVV
jgi:hypothetical protein